MRFKKGVIPALVALTAASGTGLVSYAALAAQDTAAGNAVIRTPIAITKTRDLDFGTVGEAGAGTLVLATNSGTSVTGGVTAAGGTPASAQFTVTGETGAAYNVDVNGGGANMTLTDGTNNMTANTWTDDGANITGGSVTLSVGATLTVAAAQTAGTYTGSFTVDVVYP